MYRVIISKSDNLWVARCLEVNTVAHGASAEELARAISDTLSAEQFLVEKFGWEAPCPSPLKYHEKWESAAAGSVEINVTEHSGRWFATREDEPTVFVSASTLEDLYEGVRLAMCDLA